MAILANWIRRKWCGSNIQYVKMFDVVALMFWLFENDIDEVFSFPKNKCHFHLHTLKIFVMGNRGSFIGTSYIYEMVPLDTLSTRRHIVCAL